MKLKIILIIIIIIEKKTELLKCDDMENGVCESSYLGG